MLVCVWLEPTLGAIIVFVLLVVVHARRNRGLCELRVKNGKAIAARGQVPSGVLVDVNAVLEKSNAHGTIRIMAGERFPTLVFEGNFPANLQQQLRNVLGNVRIERFRG